MNYSEFSKIVKSGDMSGAYLLYGEEEYIKDLCITAVIDKFVSEGVKELNFDKIDLSEGDLSNIEKAMLPLPFISEKRVVVVRYLELIGMTAAKLKQAQNKSKLEQLENIMDKCPKETILLFIARGFASTTMVKLFSKNKKDVDFKPPNDTQKLQYLRRIAKKNSLNISDRTLNMLAQYTGIELLELELEIKKLKAYAKDNEVSEGDIMSICSPAVEYSIFKMLKHITNRQAGEALAEYRRLMLAGQSPQSVTAMISRQFRSLFYLRELNGLGNDTLKLAAKKLGTKDFVIKNMKRIAMRLEKERIDEIVGWCADADYMVKSGRISVDNSAEMLIMKLITV